MTIICNIYRNHNQHDGKKQLRNPLGFLAKWWLNAKYIKGSAFDQRTFYKQNSGRTRERPPKTKENEIEFGCRWWAMRWWVTSLVFGPWKSRKVTANASKMLLHIIFESGNVLRFMRCVNMCLFRGLSGLLRHNYAFVPALVKDRCLFHRRSLFCGWSASGWADEIISIIYLCMLLMVFGLCEKHKSYCMLWAKSFAGQDSLFGAL